MVSLYVCTYTHFLSCVAYHVHEYVYAYTSSGLCACILGDLWGGIGSFSCPEFRLFPSFMSPQPKPATPCTPALDSTPVNSATALKNRPLSVMVTGKGTVLQKAKVGGHHGNCPGPHPVPNGPSDAQSLPLGASGSQTPRN